MDLIYTGVHATPDELRKLTKLVEKARNTPVMLVGTVDLAGNAQQRMLEACHAAALAHGLPEIPGFYGITPEGEFVTC